ncbi:MAG: hypothetical protein WD382_02185 [Halofilum sp. (in: g-proteobacteria)]
MNDDGDEGIHRQLEGLLQQEDEDREAYRNAILAAKPTYPEPRLEQEYKAYQRLRRHWSESQIRKWVDAYGEEIGFAEDVGEGDRPDIETFLDLVGLIAEGEYARTLPDGEMLALIAGKDATMGRDYSQRQAARGARGGAARWQGSEARDALDAIIARLANRRDGWGDPLPPYELWGELYSALDSAGMNPREHDAPPRYECDGLPEPLTRSAFRRRIQRTRR